MCQSKLLLMRKGDDSNDGERKGSRDFAAGDLL